MKRPRCSLDRLLALAARAPAAPAGEPSPALEAAVLRAWRAGASASEEFALIPLFRRAALGAACVLAACAAWSLLPGNAAASPVGLASYVVNLAWTP